MRVRREQETKVSHDSYSGLVIHPRLRLVPRKSRDTKASNVGSASDADSATQTQQPSNRPWPHPFVFYLAPESREVSPSSFADSLSTQIPSPTPSHPQHYAGSPGRAKPWSTKMAAEDLEYLAVNGALTPPEEPPWSSAKNSSTVLDREERLRQLTRIYEMMRTEVFEASSFFDGKRISSGDRDVRIPTLNDFSTDMGIREEGPTLAAPSIKRISSGGRDVLMPTLDGFSTDMGPGEGSRLAAPGVKGISGEDRDVPALTLSDSSIDMGFEEGGSAFRSSEDWQKNEKLPWHMAHAVLRTRRTHLRMAFSLVRLAQCLLAQELVVGSVGMFDALKALLQPEPHLQPTSLPQHVTSPLAEPPLNPASSPTASGTHSPAERPAPPNLPCRSIPQAAPEEGNNGALGALPTLNGQDNDPFTGHYGDEQPLGQSPFGGSSHAFGLAGDPGAWLEEDMSKILEGVEFDTDDAAQVLGMGAI